MYEFGTKLTRNHFMALNPSKAPFQFYAYTTSQTQLNLISADALSYSIGAVLLQKQESEEWKPVVYSSRSLMSTEQKNAQIEKEALSITWACKRFIKYLLGMDFEVEIDHKPLVSLLGEKLIDELQVPLLI